MKTTIISAATLILMSQLAFARSPNARVGDLKATSDKLARAASQTKGGAQHRLLQEREHVNGLIDSLERGQHVDPAEIDRALQRAAQPLP